MSEKDESKPDVEMADVENEFAPTGGEDAEMQEEEKKEPEKPSELEEDAPDDKRPKLTTKIEMNPCDTTVDVLPAENGMVLMGLSEGGFQHLLSGARANVGIKAGRYAFEVKVLEHLSPGGKDSGGKGKGPHMNDLKVGFSIAQSSLFIGDGSDNVGFDTGGNFWSEGKRNQLSRGARFQREEVICVLLNLNKEGPNAQTISLFKNGKRSSEPQALPEELKGKTLFPTVTFKNVTVMANFGPALMKPLPFTCRPLQDCAKADAVDSPTAPPKGGKYEVVFPVGMPDEGTFDWLDNFFLKKHPEFVELSDRKIVEWAEKSGIRVGRRGGNWDASNDKPDLSFGMGHDDGVSVKRVLQELSPALQKNLVVMEVAQNITADSRKRNLALFASPHFKKIAHVVMGPPSADFKKLSVDSLLKDRQAELDAKYKRALAEYERKKQAAEVKKKREADRVAAKKKLEKARKKAEKAKELAKKKAEKEAEKQRKKEEREKAKEAGEDVPDEEPEEEDEEMKEDEEDEKEEEEEAAAEEKPEGEAAAEGEAAEGEEKLEPPAEPAKAELTEEEAKLDFLKKDSSDLAPKIMSSLFAQFSIPEKDEGFDDIRYEWSQKTAAVKYLKAKVVHLKQTTRMEDLRPSDWFKEKHSEWVKTVADFRRKQNEWRRTDQAKPKEKKPEGDAEEAEKEEKTEDQEMAKPEGEEEAKEEKKEEAKEEGEETKKEEGEVKTEEEKKEEVKTEEKKVDFDGVEVMACEDIHDLGDGSPLYQKFEWQDWMLLHLRFELHLLAHAFKHDVDDDERPGIHDEHLAFYYNKYFKKPWTLKQFGMESLKDLMELIKSSNSLKGDPEVLASELAVDTPVENFIKLCEENRRDRERRLDAGDETAKLHFTRTAPVQQGNFDRGGAQGGRYQGGGGGGGGGFRGGGGGGRDFRGGDRGGPLGPPRYGGAARGPPPGDRGYGTYSGAPARGGYGGAPPPPPGRAPPGGAGGGYGGARRGPPGGGYEPPSKQPRVGYGGPPPARGGYGGGGAASGYGAGGGKGGRR